MRQKTMNKAPVSDIREELIKLMSEEMGRTKTRLTELRGEIERTSSQVKREEERYSDATINLQVARDQLDILPRQDISARYEEALRVLQRLTTMRGQLEKLMATRDTLEHDQQFFSHLLGKVQGADALSNASGDGEGGATRQVSANIVRIVQAEEIERQRMSRQMHDGPAQSLTNFILQAEICQRWFDRNPERAAEELVNLKSAASITFQKIRDFIFDLRPMMLDDLGIIPTVRRYVESFKDKNDIETTLEIHGEERRMQTHREVMVFRAIQELMSHARDHSGASRLQIRLDLLSDVVKFGVEDNGKGFNAEPIFASEETSSSDPRVQDLMMLREKFELVGGNIEIQSDENNGTNVRLQLPVE
jgi:two-component system, NarL family, sensor histidine kinase DegS